MEVIPAIDILQGKCVRLCKGDYNEVTVYSDKPADMARQFEDLGCKRLHVVDLEGAAADHSLNLGTLEKIACSTNLTIDFGGGIRSRESLQRAFSAGAAMITIGSSAATDPDSVKSWITEYGADRFILGADVRHDRHISVHGWKEASAVMLDDFITDYGKCGVNKVLCTDIERDGMLQGASVSLYKDILGKFKQLYLIASGGVSSVQDLEELKAAGLPAAILGKAWYEGRVTPRQLEQFILNN